MQPDKEPIKPNGKRHWGSHGFTLMLAVLGGIILLFILAPLFKMVFLSDKQALWLALLDSDTMRSIGLTIYAALISTAIGFMLGVPLAYLLARYQFPGKGVMEALVDLPIVVPHSAAGIALLFVFGSNFMVGRPSARLVSNSSTRWRESLSPCSSSACRSLSAPPGEFRKVDVRLEKVARTLGLLLAGILPVTFPSPGAVSWPAA